MKQYCEARWYFDLMRNAFVYLKAGHYEIGEEREIEKQITAREARLLVKTMDEEGFIKPRLDERLRNEDLKITHRLMDLLDRAIQGGEP